MSKNLILELLTEVRPNAEIPSTFEYRYDASNKDLTLTVKESGLKSNMQTDEAAFDSWAIALKYYLKEHIDAITIDWERDFHKGEKGYYHYNRFIYRLTKFIQTYPWARSAKVLPPIPTQLYCNIGKDDAAKISEHEEYTEGWLECKYVMDHSKEYDAMNHQFPVGLFDGKVSRSTHYTTGGKSAIDIWAIKGDCLTIFELKKSDNMPLGIISELMFYTNVMDDILSNRIQYESSKSTLSAIEKNIRGFGLFHEAYTNHRIKRIESVFLADNLHSLLTPELIGFINESLRWTDRNISFKHKKASE